MIKFPANQRVSIPFHKKSGRTYHHAHDSSSVGLRFNVHHLHFVLSLHEDNQHHTHQANMV